MNDITSFEIPCSGYSVNADFYNGQTTQRILLSLIGWTSNRKRYDDILLGISEHTGMSCLVFDYTGHGESTFDIEKTRPAQHFLEVICVFDWLAERYPDAEITVMGTSYGGFLATQLTKYREFKNLILRVPAIYRPQDFYNLAPDVHGTEESRQFRLNTEELAQHPLLKRAAQFAGNTLVVVHDKDEQVPKTTTDAFAVAFDADVQVVDAPHTPLDKSPQWFTEYQKGIAEWIQKQI